MVMLLRQAGLIFITAAGEEGYKLQVAGYRLQVTSRRVQGLPYTLYLPPYTLVTGCKLQVSGLKFLVSQTINSYRLSAVSYEQISPWNMEPETCNPESKHFKSQISNGKILFIFSFVYPLLLSSCPAPVGYR